MTLDDLLTEALAVIASGGQRMTLVRNTGARLPKGFPRGELLCEQHDGRRVYSYPAVRVLAWAEKTKRDELTRPEGRGQGG